jgi:hypothetical protein
MPLYVAKRRIPSDEFNLWMAKFAKEDRELWDRKHATPDQWYLASIAATIKNLFADKPITIEQALIEFQTKTTIDEDPLTNKRVWCGILGITLKDDDERTDDRHH